MLIFFIFIFLQPKSHLTVCNSVYETCNELGVEGQPLHNVDGLTRYRLVIQDQIE